jgi:hypothetical protein
MSAVIPRYSLTSPIANLEAMLSDPLLRILFRSELKGAVINYEFSPTDIIFSPDQLHYRFTLKEAVSDALWGNLKKIAQVIFCAANRHNPFISGPDLRFLIPYGPLEEIGLENPSIIIILAFGRNPLKLGFDSMDTIHYQVQMVKSIGSYYILWISEAIRLSLNRGYLTRWSWGAYFGIEMREFVKRAIIGLTTGLFLLRRVVDVRFHSINWEVANLVINHEDGDIIRHFHRPTHHHLYLVDITKDWVLDNFFGTYDNASVVARGDFA